jgi:multiple antibiotic resistance protein
MIAIFGEDMNLLDPIIAVLVVANLLPILPVLLDVVSVLPHRERRRKSLHALAVGNIVAVVFAISGGALLDAMHSRVDDMRVAGGLILLVFAIYDLLFSREQRKEPLGELAEESPPATEFEVGVVPLGIPLMVGPATLTTALVVAESYGWIALLVAFAVNILLNVLLLMSGDFLMDKLGHGTIRASGKVFGLLLATLAITMVRTGVTNMWGQG